VPSSEIRVADWIMQTLAEHGITHVFMVAGGGAMHLNDAAGLEPGLETIAVLHEQAAAIACESYFKASGRLAVCLVTTGPGATNAITGVTGAWLDSTPMLVISGQVKRPDLAGDSGVRQRGIQEVNTVKLVAGITKEAVMITEPSSVRYHVERALHLATSKRPGPVWLDIPLDVQAAKVDPSSMPAFDPEHQSIANAYAEDDPSDAAQAIVKLVSGASRPALLLGAGILASGAADRARVLIELLGVPVLSTWPAQGIVGDDHPLFVGRPGSLAPRAANFVIQNADALVCIGTRLDMSTTGYNQADFGRNARKLIVDVDPNELAKLTGSIDMGFCSNALDVVDSLIKLMPEADAPLWRDANRWVPQCQAWRERWPIVTAEHRKPGPHISTYHLADTISDLLLPEDVLATCCSGLGIEIFLLALRLRTGQRANCNFALGAMGYGLPTVLGACLGSGRRRTICVDGDGGLQLNIQELETIRRLDLPVKLFVLSNRGYASIRASQTRWFGRLVGADDTSGLTLPDLERIANAYRIPFLRLNGETELRPQVEAALNTAGPLLCEVPTPDDEAREPVQISEALPDGGMRSRPLEDLAPLLSREELAANMIAEREHFASPDSGSPAAGTGTGEFATYYESTD
jgi:acetolactate synthase I/II/III large subunit